MLLPFRISPVYRDYVWGGKKLRPDVELTAEAWIVYEDDVVMDGPYKGQTLGKVTELEGKALLGSKVFKKSGVRFPLLIKLLDCANWLSLQVHPNNQQAEKLAGPNFFGKNEAWYVIHADKDAQLISGFRPNTNYADVQKAVGKKEMLDLVEFRKVQTGDTIFIAPGTIHALGPGLLIYEVQQNSDITYRVYDWDRPMDGGRKLHLEESACILNPDEKGNIIPRDLENSSIRIELVSCEFFTLELLNDKNNDMAINLNGESFSVITSIDQEIIVHGKEWSYNLNPFETLFIPANCCSYNISFHKRANALLSSCNR
jgi:mannose-6-phosphate isomerase